MKKLFSILAVLACLCQVAWAQHELLDKVVAKIGDEYILLSEIEEQFASAKDQKADLPANYRCMIFDQILVNKLILNQAKIDSVLAKDEDVETQLTARFEKILDYMGGNLEQFVQYYGQTPEAMKEQMRDDMRDQLIVEKMRGKILSDIMVTPSEVRTFFSNIPKDSLPYFNQEVEIAEIVLKPKFNDVEKEKAKKQLDELRDQIVNGKKPFEELAKKFSQDPGSGREGGDLGWAKRGKFVPEFEAQAFRLEEGGLSQVFESDFGFHILQLIERRGNNIHCRHILIKPEMTDADFEKAKTTLDSVRLAILKDSLNFSYAVKTYSDKNTQSYHSDGRMTNPASGNNSFETRDLDPDTYFAADTMKVGRISAPIEVTAQSGERYYRVVKLLAKSSPHKANLSQDYNKIHSAAVESKKNDRIMKWIDEKSQNTYISIDPMFKYCPNLEKWGKRAKP
jgi:peptidyl-prolyl cis-trans isomerase SurA